MRNQGYSKLDGVLKVLLIFFIALLAFSAGVFSGKGMAERSYDHVALSNKEYSKDKFPTLVTEDEDTESPLSQQEMEVLAEDAVKTAQSEANTSNEGSRVVASESSPKAHSEPAETLASGHGASASAHGSAPATSHGKAASANAPAAADHAASAMPAAALSATGHGATSEKATATNKHESKETAPTKNSQNAHGLPAKGHGPASESPAAQRVAEGLPPSQNVHPKSQPVGQLPTAVGEMKTGYTVQVGSYPSEAEAKKVADDLTGKGHPAFTVAAEIKGKTWHRVCVGTYKTSDEAGKSKQELLAKNMIKAGLVQKIAK